MFMTLYFDNRTGVCHKTLERFLLGYVRTRAFAPDGWNMGILYMDKGHVYFRSMYARYHGIFVVWN